MQRVQTRSRAPQWEHKTFLFKSKTIDETGHFTGYLSVFGNADEGADIVQKGAFTKTLSELETKRKKSESPYLFPILWEHDPKQPIGGFTVAREDAYGLYVEGELDQDVQKGREARSGLKKGYIPGLSIGYDTIKQQFKNNFRYLVELRLWEGSVTSFPMNTEAVVLPQNVKSKGATMPDATEKKATDFATAFATAQNDLQERWHDCFGALVQAIYSTMQDATVTDKAEAVKTTVTQFSEALDAIVSDSVEAAFSPCLDYDLDSFADSSGNNVYGVDMATNSPMYGYMSAGAPDETKSGAVMSKGNHAKMGAALDQVSSGVKSLVSLHAAMAPAGATKPGAADDDATPTKTPAKGGKSTGAEAVVTPAITHEDESMDLGFLMMLDRMKAEAKSFTRAA